METGFHQNKIKKNIFLKKRLGFFLRILWILWILSMEGVWSLASLRVGGSGMGKFDLDRQEFNLHPKKFDLVSIRFGRKFRSKPEGKKKHTGKTVFFCHSCIILLNFAVNSPKHHQKRYRKMTVKWPKNGLNCYKKKV